MSSSVPLLLSHTYLLQTTKSNHHTFPHIFSGCPPVYRVLPTHIPNVPYILAPYILPKSQSNLPKEPFELYKFCILRYILLYRWKQPPNIYYNISLHHDTSSFSMPVQLDDTKWSFQETNVYMPSGESSYFLPILHLSHKFRLPYKEFLHSLRASIRWYQ